MIDSEETRRDKRPNTEMDFSSISENGQRTKSPWAQVMYSSLNRFEELELSINHSLEYAHDTATQAFASTGVNSVSIIKGVVNCQNSRDKGPPEGNSARG